MLPSSLANIAMGEAFYLVFGLLQLVLVGLASWTLLTVNNLLMRVARIETQHSEGVGPRLLSIERRLGRLERSMRMLPDAIDGDAD